ncbi:MAG: hypothetical protein HPY50_03885 [Firmicutes bacterium]|nr:hypothetical protein [Bacillota bacterium]
MFDFLNNPKTQETIGRTILNTVKLGVVAALFFAAQNAFYKHSNETIGSAAQMITNILPSAE